MHGDLTIRIIVIIIIFIIIIAVSEALRLNITTIEIHETIVL